MTKKSTVGKKAKVVKPKEIAFPKHKNERGYSYDEIKAFLSPKEFSQFNKWIYGQTCPLGDNRELLVYPWDFERFVRLVRQGTPTYFD